MAGRIENTNCIVILAAGSSSRLGQPKQHLSFQSGTLLQHAVHSALAAKAGVVVLVSGAVEIQDITDFPTDRFYVVQNPGWQEGIASSIRMGLQEALKISPATDAVLIMGCDQPFVDSGLLNNLLTLQQQTRKDIVCSAYSGTVGIPAVFSKAFFAKLLALEGDAGAKRIMLEHPAVMEKLYFPKGGIDIDEPADIENLKNIEPDGAS